MRQAEKEKKKILVPNSVHTRPWQENSEKYGKKIQKTKKTSFRHYFYPKRDEIIRESEKKILVPTFIHSRPELENSEKNSKKNHKIKKHTSDNNSSQNGMRQVEKGRKKFQSRISFIRDPGKKIPKKIAKKFKKLENLFPAIFLAKTG